MLEFSNAPYQFFPADPSRSVMELTRQANRFFILNGANHRVTRIELSGEREKVEELHATGARILFVANHPSHSDPQLMIEVQRRLGIKSFFMAAYDVFLRSDFQAWFMQKMGSFSIDREGNDRKAMSAAIDTLKTGDYALTIFPEGNVYLMNDRVTPFLDGTSFIAVKAHQALKGSGEVWIVPISFKFSQIDDIKEKIWDRLKTLSSDCGFCGILDPSNPEEAVVNVGAHLLSRFFKEKTDLVGDFNFSGLSGEELKERLYKISKQLIGDLEDKLDLERNDEIFVVDRIRKVRSKIRQIRLSEASSTSFSETEISKISDRAILSFRILAYVLPYFKEQGSLDRYAETVERLCEDFYSRAFRPLGRRRGMAKIGSPISVQAILDQTKGKTRTAIPEITQLMESTIQNGINELNKENTAFGKVQI